MQPPVPIYFDTDSLPWHAEPGYDGPMMFSHPRYQTEGFTRGAEGNNLDGKVVTRLVWWIKFCSILNRLVYDILAQKRDNILP